MNIFCALVSCALITCAYALWCRRRRLHRMLDHLPQLPTLPFIGNVHYIWRGSEQILRFLTDSAKKTEETNKPFVWWLGPIPIIGLIDPVDIKTVTNECIEKPELYKVTHNWLKDGLITAPGSLWKHTSRKLSGVFNTTMVDGYQDIFNTQAHKLMTLMKTEARRAPFDVTHKYINWVSLETIYQIALGLPEKSNSGMSEEYLSVFGKTLKMYLERALVLPYHFDFLFRLSSAYKELTRCENTLNKAVERVIQKRTEERHDIKRNKIQLVEQHDQSSFKSYLDVLLELSESDPLFTPEQIMAELSTIMAAGHETVATALNMSLLMIGSHPEVQDKLYAEMQEIFGNSNRPVTKKDLARMQYCEAVVNEVLRVYPAVPAVFRKADKDVALKTCTIPESALFAINIWGTGRSKNIWGPDAETFRPERWLENMENPFFIPFSYGKRNCIGKRYSIAMLKTTLAYCVRELIIKADTTHLRLKSDITLEPISGHLIQVRIR